MKTRVIVYISVSLLVLVLFGAFMRIMSVAESSVIDDSLTNYEEFQTIYNVCQQTNTDLATIQQMDDHDPMFVQFSKASIIAAKKQKLARWVEEYNAKSKMWNRALWKSKTLPYQLDVNDFSNYNGK